MPDLHALVYVSIATRQLSIDETDHLLFRAQARNETYGVTGALLYTGGHFMQYIEGPAAGMSTIYDIIKADAQHHGIIELLRTPVETREFPEWSMGFQSKDAYGMSNPYKLMDFLPPEVAHSSKALSYPRSLLNRFWNRASLAESF